MELLPEEKESCLTEHLKRVLPLLHDSLMYLFEFKKTIPYHFVNLACFLFSEVKKR
jgi:hypothetical protein